MGTTTTKFQTQISENPVVIYSKSTCGYCTKARKLLDEEGIKYLNVEMDQVDNGREIFESVKEVTHSRFVPQIFLCGKSVGGFSELSEMQNAGLLKVVLDQCATKSRY